MACPRWLTKDGFEYQFQVNYLSHYLLTRLLLDKMAESSPGRILNVTSKLYETANLDLDDVNFEKNYNPLQSYQRSKLCNILFTEYLNEYLKSKNTNQSVDIRAYSISPGIVFTNLGRHIKNYKLLSVLFYPILWFLLRRPKQGAETIVYCATSPDLSQTPGYYFRDCKELKLEANANNHEQMEKLWNMSEELVKKWLD